MRSERCFEFWAPDGVTWTQWAKPSLFTQLDAVESPPPQTLPDVSWLPGPTERMALVIDLGGPDSVTTGLALARLGYRPVPLFNTCLGVGSVIDCAPIAGMLEAGAETLAGLGLDPSAPPAFLLDANRVRPQGAIDPGKLDNRWVVFPQDFPSATFLRAQRIEGVVVVQEGTVVQEDLVHVLLRWRERGLKVMVGDAKALRSVPDVVLKKPSLFKRAWYRALRMAGLRRNQAGGFGGFIPLPSRGGGYG